VIYLFEQSKEMLETLQNLNSHLTRTNFIILPETFQ
ncbi:uncharacterized protein METZ01_LOCUS364194, partial [marine metagenome]